MADTRITDAEIAGYMGWRGPGAYTEASLRKIRQIVDHVLRAERATPPSPSTAPEELRNVFDLAWKQALDDASFYVAGHCADGEHHVEHIRELVPPKLRVRGVEIASRPAEVDDEGLPPLPDAWHGFRFNSGWNTWEQVSHWAKGDEDVTRAYTAEQYRQGQRDAVAADRARREKGGA